MHLLLSVTLYTIRGPSLYLLQLPLCALQDLSMGDDMYA